MRDPAVVAVVPAHNEEGGIAGALESILRQTRPPDAILVILDNCTDRTEEVVVGGFPEVGFVKTFRNRARKAGALNQALPYCDGYTYLLVVDADAVLDPYFIEKGMGVVESDPAIGAMSCREGVRPLQSRRIKDRIIYAFVRYQRYLWDSARMQRPHDTEIMVGNGMLIRHRALREIGGFNEEEAIEDTALGIDLRLAGWRTVLGEHCYSWSETPVDLKRLWRQRVRWGRGEMVFLKRPWRRGSWRAKLTSYFLYWLALWYIILIAVDLVHRDYFSWWWLAPWVLLYADRLMRVFRTFPDRRVSDLILALPPFEVMIFFLY